MSNFPGKWDIYFKDGSVVKDVELPDRPPENSKYARIRGWDGSKKYNCHGKWSDYSPNSTDSFIVGLKFNKNPREI